MSAAERLAIDYGLGTTGLGVLTLLAGRAGLLDPWIFRIGLSVIAVAGLGMSRFWRLRWSWGRSAADAVLPLLVMTPFLVIMLLGSMLPSIDFDVLEYHLQGPKEYFQAGRIAFLPHNVYTSMPFGVEMLHLMGMEVLGDWWWGGLVGQLPGGTLRPRGGRDDCRDGRASGISPRSLAGGRRLPVHAVDLPDGCDRLRRGAALLLSLRPDLGRDPELDRGPG